MIFSRYSPQTNLPNVKVIPMYKKELGLFMKDRGEKVPKIYFSLDTAVNSGKPVILRSDHPIESIGASGILESVSFRKGESVGEINQYMNSIKFSAFEQFCKVLGIDFEQASKDIKYSYWEFIPGINGTMVADDSVKGRYHVILKKPYSDKAYRDTSYCVFEKDKENILINSDEKSNCCNLSRRNLETFIDFYESAREGVTDFYKKHFEGVSSDNCPIIEFQYVPSLGNRFDQIYFLQGILGRDFEASSVVFTPEQEKEFLADGFQKMNYVRGNTNGEIVSLNTIYGVDDFEIDFGGSENFDASFNVFTSNAYIEAVTNLRRGCFINSNFSNFLWQFSGEHAIVSQVFKPEIFGSFKLEDVLKSLNDRQFIIDTLTLESMTVPFNLEVASDGYQGFVRVSKDDYFKAA